MSATLNADKFSAFFGGDEVCPLVHVPGFTYPVQQLFLEDIVRLLGRRFIPVPIDDRGRRRFGGRRAEERGERAEYERYLQKHVRYEYDATVADKMAQLNDRRADLTLTSALIDHLLETTPHTEAILVFMPGWSEIRDLSRDLSSRYGSRHVIVPLHSLLPSVDQRAVFERPASGRRKIVIATTIAETSITIDDVVHVVDCGLTKLSDVDQERNVQTLDLRFVSRANLKQRAGRAGRVQAGYSYHLLSNWRVERLEEHPKPELLRSRLETVCLQVKVGIVIFYSLSSYRLI